MKLLEKAGGAAAVLASLAIAAVAAAQTTTDGTGIDYGTVNTATTTGTTTPGVPSTGVGGDATINAILLGASLLVLLGGIAYFALRRSPETG